MELPETDSEDELPPGWEERCTADGLVFYAHHGSQSTYWTHPRTNKRKKVTGQMPYGWERQITDDGKVFFVDHIDHKTTYSDPRLAFAIEETQSIHDLRQRFDGSSKALQILHGRDLTGLTAIVTGSNCGIGFETARSLCFHGCTVVFACRNLAKAEAAVKCLVKERPRARCHVLRLDLSSLTSVRNFAYNFSMQFECCDILILNAGVFGLPITLTEDGLETMFQVNHLSHMYLTLLLRPKLSAAEHPRVVFVASESHRFSPITSSSDITEKRLSCSSDQDYCSLNAYNNSKLFNVLCTFELQRRFEDLGLRCFAVHPGNVISTSLSRNWWCYRILFALVRPFSKSMQQACASVIYSAASPEMGRCGGLYINNCVPCTPSDVALNPIIANKLWSTSLNIIESIMGKSAFNLS